MDEMPKQIPGLTEERVAVLLWYLGIEKGDIKRIREAIQNSKTLLTQWTKIKKKTMLIQNRLIAETPNINISEENVKFIAIQLGTAIGELARLKPNLKDDAITQINNIEPGFGLLIKNRHKDIEEQEM